MGEGRVVAGDLPAVMHSGVEKAIGMQHSAVANYVQRLRRGRPTAAPAEIIATLERQYLAAVTGTGAVLGGAAAVPGAGTGLALALSAGETAVFLETTVLFTLAVAEVHAIRVDDIERRRALVLTVVFGDGGAMLVEKTTGRTSEHWGRLLTDLLPMSSISAINKTLCRWFMAQYPRNHGLRLLGKILPFGIGAGIAAAGNHAFGRLVVSANKRVFGAPPVSFTDYVDGNVVDATTPVSDMPRQAVGPAPLPVAEPPAAPEPPAAEPPAVIEQPATVAEPPAITEPAAATARPDPSVTGKYRPLFDHLVDRGTDRVEISFSAIAALVDGGLPKSAATRAWWGNSANSRQAKAWLAAGFAVVNVDLISRMVRFEKRGGPS